MEESTQTKTQTEAPEQRDIKYAGQDPDLVPVSRWLGIEHVAEISGPAESKIGTILKWARAAGQDRVDILYLLSQTERQLDPPPIGVSRLDRLYQWAMLELEEANIKKQKQTLSHG